MKRPLNQQKTFDIFHYYLKNGFDHTTDEIVAAMGISRKTFFNRYEGKAQSVEIARQFWHTCIQDRIREKSLECNHPVEELLLFIWEMRNIRKTEGTFFQYALQHKLFTSDDSPFMSILSTLIQKGIRQYHFQEDINIPLYSTFFLHNVCVEEDLGLNQDQVIRYLLLPLLTERGMELLNDVDMAYLFSLPQ